jgi:hypothetical protein
VDNIISVNCTSLLIQKLKDKKCRPFSSDLHVHILKNSFYTFQDFSVFCRDIKITDDKFHTATNPAVIIEIPTPSRD